MTSPAAPRVPSPQAPLLEEKERRASGVHRIAPAELADNWSRLVALWEQSGYDGEPPRCMAEYADDVIEAMR